MKTQNDSMSVYKAPASAVASGPSKDVAVAHSVVVPVPADASEVKLGKDLSMLYPDLKFPKTGITMFSGWPKSTSGFAQAYQYAKKHSSRVREVEVRVRSTCQQSAKIGLERVGDIASVKDIERVSLGYLRADAGKVVNDVWAKFARRHRIKDYQDYDFRYGFSDPRYIDDLLQHEDFKHLKVIVHRVRHNGESLMLATIPDASYIESMSLRAGASADLVVTL